MYIHSRQHLDGDHETIARLLIKKRADVDAKEGSHGNAF